MTNMMEAFDAFWVLPFVMMEVMVTGPVLAWWWPSGSHSDQWLCGLVFCPAQLCWPSALCVWPVLVLLFMCVFPLLVLRLFIVLYYSIPFPLVLLCWPYILFVTVILIPVVPLSVCSHSVTGDIVSLVFGGVCVGNLLENMCGQTIQ